MALVGLEAGKNFTFDDEEAGSILLSESVAKTPLLRYHVSKAFGDNELQSRALRERLERLKEYLLPFMYAQ